MSAIEAELGGLSLSRRRLLTNSAKLTAVAAVFLSVADLHRCALTPTESLPVVTEEIAGHWTTF